MDWHNAIDTTLQADRVTPIISMWTSPCFLVYGKEAILPPNICLLAIQLSQSARERSSNFFQIRNDALLKLEGERNKDK